MKPSVPPRRRALTYLSTRLVLPTPPGRSQAAAGAASAWLGLLLALLVGVVTGSPPAVRGQQADFADPGNSAPGIDYGDLPDTGPGIGAGNYRTLASDGGASHIVVGSRHLGWCVDDDGDAGANAQADGDDLSPQGKTTLHSGGGCEKDGDDEDGVLFEPMVEGRLSKITVITAGNDCRINAWIDWNGNGSFLDSGEEIAKDFTASSSELNLLPVVPPPGSAGARYARFRCSSSGGLGPDGTAPDGEVEDYLVDVAPDVVTEPSYSIGGLVWNDLDGDGLQEAGEPGLSGARVEVFPNEDCSGTLVATATSGGSGDYRITSLSKGTHCVAFTPDPTSQGEVWAGTVQRVGTGNGSDIDPVTHRAVLTLGTDRPDIAAGFRTRPGQCSTTEVGGTVYREVEMNGDADGSLHMTFANSPLQSSFSGSNGSVESQAPRIEDFTGDNPYSWVGKDRLPLRRAETGQPGVTVAVYGDGGALLGTTTTDSEGHWRLTPSGGLAGTPVIVEFSGWPSHMASGPAGRNNGSSVVATTLGSCAVDFTVGNPGDHCSETPALALSGFVGRTVAEGGMGPMGTLLELPWTEGGPYVAKTGFAEISPGFTWAAHVADEEFMPPSGEPTMIAGWGMTGNVFGLAADARREVVYSGAFYRNSAPVGDAGYGAIYRDSTLWLDLAAPPLDLTVEQGEVCNYDPSPSPFLDLQEFTSSAYTPGPVQCVNDVGFMGLGDLEMDDDFTTLFTLNLATQQIVAIPLLSSGDPDTANVRLYPAPVPSECAANPDGFSRDRAPFALGYHEEKLYVGVTCTDTGSDREGPHGFVFSFDPTVPPGSESYTQVLAVDLAFERYDWLFGASWDPLVPGSWRFTGSSTGYVVSQNVDWGEQTDHYFFDEDGWYWDYPSGCTARRSDRCHRNQPWLVDIEFDLRTDGRDDLIIGVRNRLSDIWRSAPSANQGTLIRFCETSAEADAWTQEVPGTGFCADLVPGTGRGETRFDPPFGADAPRFFYHYGAEGAFASGTLAALPGFVELAATGTGNIHYENTSGVSFLSQDDGAHERAVLLSGTLSFMASEFKQASNWGDIEPVCPPAPMEIGNRVWLDSNGNGLQDPAESGIFGVALTLYADANRNGELDGAEGDPSVAVATTTTDEDGLYSFSREGHGVGYDEFYIVAIAASNFEPRGPLAHQAPTLSGVGGTDTRDSDGAVLTGIVQAPVQTSGPGRNNQSVDFGFTPPMSSADLALRLTTTTRTAVEPGDDVTFTIQLVNQGNQPAGDLQIIDFVTPGSWLAFDPAKNPPGTTGGYASLPYAWISFGPRDGLATISGTLAAGDTITLPVTLTVGESPRGSIDNHAEIYRDDLADRDSTPELEQGNWSSDTVVDDVLDNHGGDEDDHDIATVRSRGRRPSTP